MWETWGEMGRVKGSEASSVRVCEWIILAQGVQS
jgi:hypothetical protein